MLSNKDLLDVGHKSAEEITPLYRYGHNAIVTGSQHIYDDASYIAALNEGVSVFEAMSSLVTSPPETTQSQVAIQSCNLFVRSNQNTLGDYMDKSLSSLYSDAPRTAEVVDQVAARFHPYLTRFAILGTALARQFELDAGF